MPMYDEFSVKEFWPHMTDNAEFMRYLPSSMPKGRAPCRTYFFNIMNTVMENYVQEIIAHANKVRATKQHMCEAIQTIEVTDEWYKKLTAIPFISRKFKFLVNI